MEKQIIYEGQPTNYLVTEEGKIFSKLTGKELKGTIARNEYRSVCLTIHGKPKSLMVHRLVAEAFCDNPNGYTIVDHINRNKLDNRAENLRWASARENGLNKEPKITNKEKEYFDIENEEWKVCFENSNYGVSPQGKIFNIVGKNILKPEIRNGYERVKLGKKNCSVHRLVYEAFVGPIPEGKYIDHIDANRSNNCISNLQLITQSENMKKTFVLGRKDSVGVTSFSIDGKELKHYITMQEAATELGVTHTAVKTAANYGTKSGNRYWLRDDSITTKEEFVTSMPDNVQKYKDFQKIKVSSDNQFYSSASKHIIPKFKDENGIYVYLPNGTKYEKFYT